MIRLQYDTENMILKLQYDINRETEKYKYLMDEGILLSNQRQIITFTYSTLGKAFERQTKTIKVQGEKQKSN